MIPDHRTLSPTQGVIQGIGKPAALGRGQPADDPKLSLVNAASTARRRSSPLSVAGHVIAPLSQAASTATTSNREQARVAERHAGPNSRVKRRPSTDVALISFDEMEDADAG